MSNLNQDLINASFWGKIKKAERLINQGADVNAKDKYGRTSLMWASMYGYDDLAQLLIENGAK